MSLPLVWPCRWGSARCWADVDQTERGVFRCRPGDGAPSPVICEWILWTIAMSWVVVGPGPFKLDTWLVRGRVAAATSGFRVIPAAHNSPATSSKATAMQAPPRLIELVPSVVSRDLGGSAVPVRRERGLVGLPSGLEPD